MLLHKVFVDVAPSVLGEQVSSLVASMHCLKTANYVEGEIQSGGRWEATT